MFSNDQQNIEYPGSLISVRRGSFACVANGHSYALLDVEHQQKIPLFPISSLEGNSEGMVGGKAVDISLSSASASQQRPGLRAKSAGHGNESHNHGRSTSLGVIFGGLGRREQSPRPRSQDRAELRQDAALVDGTPPALSQSDGMVVPDGKESLPRTTSYDKPLPLPPDTPRDQPGISQTPFTSQSSFLKPHVLSPTSNEFLLTTGTTSSDRGVGVFVNMDGDVCRSTIEFQRYPEAVVLDLQETDASSHGAVPEQSSQGYVLTAMEGSEQYPGEKGIEIQRLDGDEEDIWEKKAWLRVPLAATGSATGSPATPHKKIGIQELNSACVISSIELSKALQLVRLRLLNDSPLDDSEDVSHKPGLQSLPSQNGPPENGNGLTQASRNEIPATNEKLIQSRDASRLREEEQFARRFSMQYSRLVLWAGNQIWLMVRNPLAMRLEATLESAVTQSSGAHAIIDRSVVIEVLDNIRGQESTTETHFLSLGYIRQKASLFLFISLMEALSNEMAIPAEETQRTEESLLEGTVDPRVLMAMVPLLRQDIEEGQQGIWIHGGVRSHVEHYISSAGHLGWGETQPGVFNRDLLYILRRYLSTWRRKKGFGSVADEKQVFESVDAGLLHVLLELDKINILGSVAGHSVRTDLYALVDQGVDSFDRAIVLLERYQRLYVLSRLYQSRKLSGKVLSTWRRILEGDVDEGGEFVNGENEVKKYLAMVRDPGLVEDYGSWLARRNPRLGVQVFADERSRVRLPPDKIIEVLRSRAPNSLREYLEHMVFGRNVRTLNRRLRWHISTDGEQMSRYVNDLIFLYLDGVLPVLESSEHARAILSQSYEAYRALRPPRPTYREFITENSIDEQWWHDRLRLLQLLGGSHGAVLGYDVPAALGRIEPFEKELVPEMIILDGKQARHRPALRLLIHGLGDYDSAINYCLLGGSSIFYPTFGAAPQEVVPSPEEQAVLFGHLLSEFLQISDPEDRAEQTGGLLERFGRWYDASQVGSLLLSYLGAN